MDKETAHRVREPDCLLKVDTYRFENERDALPTYHGLCLRGSADSIAQFLHPLYARLRYNVSCIESLRERVLLHFRRNGLG